MEPSVVRAGLDAIYNRLWQTYGPQHWWPGDTPTEVAIGAILTQNTAWTNVERAIARLKAADAMDWPRLREMPAERLETLIQPSGTFRIKARRVKALAEGIVEEFGGRVEALSDWPVDRARGWLLAIHGIGPETADAILLYAAGRTTFVVDAYTRRVLRRHGFTGGGASYHDVQAMFHQAYGNLAQMPQRAALAEGRLVERFNEFHALFVAVGKRHCRSRARCTGCPLEDLPHDETR